MRTDSRFTGHVLCPWHEEDTPSCAIYDDGHFYSFCCGRHGLIEELGAIKEMTPEQKLRGEKIRESQTTVYKEIAYLTGHDYFKLSDVNAELFNNLCINYQRSDNRHYFANRGIDLWSVMKWKLGWTGSKYTIPIYRKGKPYSIKFRRNEENDWDVKYSMIRGTKICMFNTDAIYYKKDYILLTEGEIDTIPLAQFGFPALTSIGGCNGYKEEWRQEFGSKRIYVLFDNDEPGQIAAENVRTMYKATNILSFPDDYKDVNEMLVKLGRDKFVKSFKRLEEKL